MSEVRSRAFGLDVMVGFPAPALPPYGGPEGSRRVALEAAGAVPVEWDDGRASRRGQLPAPPAEPLAIADEHPELGWRLSAGEPGSFLVPADGTHVVCVPGEAAPEDWQRFLIAHALPLAAVLQGLELLHASAVALDGGAVAFVGPSGVGKSSVAVQLLLRGASWVTDDVVALETTDAGVVAHPGSALIALRPDEAERVSTELGAPIGANPREVLYAVEPCAGPLDLRAVFFLERSDGGQVAFEPLDGPRLVLGSVFSRLVATPDRLERALDVAARLSAAVPMSRLRVPPGLDAPQLAEVVERAVRGERPVTA